MLMLLALLMASDLIKEDRVQCNNCLLVSKLLENQLMQIEPSSEREGLFGQRRRLAHPRSEQEIFKTIDEACAKVHELEPALDSACQSLLPGNREALEELVFAEGPARVRHKLCTELAQVCRPHTLHDTGEL